MKPISRNLTLMWGHLISGLRPKKRSNHLLALPTELLSKSIQKTDILHLARNQIIRITQSTLKNQQKQLRVTAHYLERIQILLLNP